MLSCRLRRYDSICGLYKLNVETRLGAKISGALVVAIDEINANLDVLPGYRLNYIHENTCGQVLNSE